MEFTRSEIATTPRRRKWRLMLNDKPNTSPNTLRLKFETKENRSRIQAVTVAFISKSRALSNHESALAFSGMIITVGKDAGVGNINGWNLPSFVCKYLKSKDLFTSRYWDIMHQKA